MCGIYSTTIDTNFQVHICIELQTECLRNKILGVVIRRSCTIRSNCYQIICVSYSGKYVNKCTIELKLFGPYKKYYLCQHTFKRATLFYCNRSKYEL